MDEKDYIKSKVDIVKYIGQYTVLTAANGYYYGKCPLHNDHHPSLLVYPQTQTFECKSASCGKQGDIFSFIREKDGVDFKEAMKKAAAFAGVSYRGSKPDPNKIYLQGVKDPCKITDEMLMTCDFIVKDFPSEIPLITDRSDFGKWLHTIFDDDAVQRIVRRYYLGLYKDNHGVVFYYIDKHLNVRTCKRMYYYDGHRIKGSERFMHTEFNLPTDWKLNDCFFGEHLLQHADPSTTKVGICESEKGACILSEVYPQYVWLASGGSNGITNEKLADIKDYEITLFPDTDSYAEWFELAKKYRDHAGLKIVCNDALELGATEEERARKIGIDDWVISDLMEARKATQEHQLLQAEQLPIQEETAQSDANLSHLKALGFDEVAQEETEDKTLQIPIYDEKGKQTKGSVKMPIEVVPQSIVGNPDARLISCIDFDKQTIKTAILSKEQLPLHTASKIPQQTEQSIVGKVDAVVYDMDDKPTDEQVEVPQYLVQTYGADYDYRPVRRVSGEGQTYISWSNLLRTHYRAS